MENAQRRRIFNDMIDTFSTRAMVHGGDVDEAVDCLSRELAASDLTRAEVVELLAYATRRMWYKRAETRVSMN